MKSSTIALTQIFLSTQFVTNNAFVCNSMAQPKAFVTSASSSTSIRPASSLFMESDFASAMPEKPKLSPKEAMYEKATSFIVDLETRIGEGVDAVPELEALRNARDEEADEKEMAIKIYELMIESGMVYDQDPETGILTPTNFDIKNNLDIPEVKAEFAYLYKYGMNLCLTSILEVDEVKDIVKKRLIERTGLTPEEFDSWLGY